MNYNMFYKKTVDFLKPITLHFEHSNVFSLEVFSITKVVIEFNYVLFSNSKNKFKVMKTRQQTKVHQSTKIQQTYIMSPDEKISFQFSNIHKVDKIKSLDVSNGMIKLFMHSHIMIKGNYSNLPLST